MAAIRKRQPDAIRLDQRRAGIDAVSRIPLLPPEGDPVRVTATEHELLPATARAS